MVFVERMDASATARKAKNAHTKADRLARRASKIAEKKPEKAVDLEQRAEAEREHAAGIEARGAERHAALVQAREAQTEAKAKLAEYRRTHPLEVQLNRAASMHMWPKASHGRIGSGPVKGAHAELFNANAHKQWTATRLASNATLGVATGGLGMSGRKNVGQAQIAIQLANGTVSTFKVKPQDLNAANKYVMSFNAFSESLSREDDGRG